MTIKAHYDSVTGKVQYDPVLKKVIVGGVEYADLDCCCFLDPSTPLWYDNITYDINDIRIYGGYGHYKSAQNNNLNHAPNPSQTNEWWIKLNSVIPCGNENWDAHSPFGGIGKSPKYIRAAFSGIGASGRLWDPRCFDPPYPEPNFYYTPNRSFILMKSSGAGCIYSCSVSGLPLSDYYESSGEWTTYFETINILVSNTYSPNVQMTISRTPPPWRLGHSYGLTRVIEGGSNYICYVPHTASSDNRPGSGANWEDYWHPDDNCDDNWCGGFIFEGDFSGCQGFEDAILNCCEGLTGQEYEDCIDEYRGTGGSDLVSDGKGSLSISILTSGPPSCPAWISGHDYNEGETVLGSDGEGYLCYVAHTSTSDDRPVISDNWEDYWIASSACSCDATPTKRTLHISTGVHGSVTTPGEGDFDYDYPESETIDIVAVADEGYVFENWTGRAADYGNIVDPNAATTTILMDASYAIKANFVEIPPEDTDPPIPNPSTWAIVPVYDVPNSKHKMTATTATDDSPPVYYQFVHVSGGGSSSDWQTSSYYECSASSHGAYKVRTKDSLGNIGSYSGTYDTYYGYL